MRISPLFPLCALIVAILFSGGCHPSVPTPRWHTFRGTAMGTTIQISIEHTDPTRAQTLSKQLNERIAAAAARLSAFAPDSEITHLNQSAAQAPVAVSPQVYRYLEQSLFYSALTHGAFDITFASAGHLYQWRERIHPDPDTLARKLSAVNYRNVILDPQHTTVFFALPGTRIDLGGIAKGAVVDECIEWLKDQGIEHAVVNAGGDTRVLGDHNGKPWRFGIRHPRQADEVIAMIPVSAGAISTSGDYVRYFDEGGLRYHHILDPRDGKPVQGIQSVTITGPEAALTDTLSTAVFVLGVGPGLALVESLDGVEALIMDSDGQIHRSSGLRLDPSEPACAGSFCPAEPASPSSH